MPSLASRFSNNTASSNQRFNRKTENSRSIPCQLFPLRRINGRTMGPAMFRGLRAVQVVMGLSRGDASTLVARDMFCTQTLLQVVAIPCCYYYLSHIYRKFTKVCWTDDSCPFPWQFTNFNFISKSSFAHHYCLFCCWGKVLLSWLVEWA